MGKQPAFMFYPGDWVQDTRSLSLATKGAWIDILCALWRSQTRGSLTLPIIGWARLISATVAHTEAVITELVDMRVCECTKNSQNLSAPDDRQMTLINRRMFREGNERLQHIERQRKYVQKRRSKNNVNSPHDKPDDALNDAKMTSYSSSSYSNTEEKEINKEKEKPIVEPEPRSTSPPSNHFRENAKEILKFLNLKAARQYEPNKTNLDFIINRLKEGSTPGQCRQVVAKKCREWLTDEKMTLYLRPATLFNKTKFAQYRGELVLIPENEEGENTDAKMP